MKVFLDANFLVAAGFRPDGDYRAALEKSPDEFIASAHIVAEVDRNLRRLGIEPAQFIEFVERTITLTDKFDLLPAGLPLEGAGDRQALAEAIGAGADLFVTSDADFGALFGRRVKGVLIEKSSAYVRRVLA